MVIPISFFEKDGPRYYNSVAVADADGEILGVYRKSHIPDGPGYQEKYYFRPGDTGFKVWKTRPARSASASAGTSGIPEAARAMVLDGRRDPALPHRHRLRAARRRRSTPHVQWQRAMQGHAVANAVPVVAANRIGLEDNDGATPDILRPFLHRRPHAASWSRASATEDEGVLVHSFDLDEIARYRADWGFFRDRRTDLYDKAIR